MRSAQSQFTRHRLGAQPGTSHVFIAWNRPSRSIQFATRTPATVPAAAAYAGGQASASPRGAVRVDWKEITAVHYEKAVKDRDGKDKLVEGKVYLFFFLTHPEYDKDSWKEQL